MIRGTVRILTIAGLLGLAIFHGDDVARILGGVGSTFDKAVKLA